MPTSPVPRALFVTDLDGTLLDGSRQVAARNLEAMARASEAGVELALVTGRRRSTVEREYPKLEGLRYRVATSNGAVILDPTNRWAEKVTALDWGVVDWVTARRGRDPDLEPATVFCITAPPAGPSASDGLPDCFLIDGRDGRFSMSWTPYRPETHTPADPAVARAKTLVHVAIKLPERDRADRLAVSLRPDLPAAVSLHVVVSPVGDGALTEIVPRGGKGLALTYLAAALGLERRATAAIGDELNDCDLLDAAGHRFAVGGSMLARSRRDVVEVAAAGDGAVAEALERFLTAIG